MSYISNAKREFLKLGYKPIEECEEGPDKWIQEAVIKLLNELSEQGHSGSSIGYAIYFFKKMALLSEDETKKEFLKLGYKPIEECENDPDKWFQEGTLDLLNIFSSGYKDPKVIEFVSKLGLHEPLSPIMCTDDEWGDVSSFGPEKTFQNKRCGAVFKEGIDGKPYYLDAIVFRNQNGNTFTGSSVLNSKNEKISSRQTIKIPFIPKTFYIDVIENEYFNKMKDESQLKEVWKYYEKPLDIRDIRLKKLQIINDKFCY